MIAPLDADDRASAQHWIVCCDVIGFAPPSVEVTLRVQAARGGRGLVSGTSIGTELLLRK
jgi:hypothetical protein